MGCADEEKSRRQKEPKAAKDVSGFANTCPTDAQWSYQVLIRQMKEETMDHNQGDGQGHYSKQPALAEGLSDSQGETCNEKSQREDCCTSPVQECHQRQGTKHKKKFCEWILTAEPVVLWKVEKTVHGRPGFK